MIDLHCHVLAGLDDGPSELDGSVALVAAARDGGTDAMVATPHVNWGWQNSAAAIAQARLALTERLADEGVAVAIHPGAEIALTHAFELDDGELEALRLGAGPWILVEAPHVQGVAGVEAMLGELAERGQRIVLAHVERCPAFLADPQLLERMVGRGMLASVTAGALVGRFGRAIERAAGRFIAAGLIHNVASDAHDLRMRPPGLRAELDAAGLHEQATWLADAVPAAILRGAEIPAAPAWPEPSRRGLFRRRG